MFGQSASPDASSSLLLRRAACESITNLLGWESLRQLDGGGGGGGGGAGGASAAAAADVGRRTFVTLAADTARNLRAFIEADTAANANANANVASGAWNLAPGQDRTLIHLSARMKA